MPFKNKTEGNLFRSWVNKKYPKYAKSIDLEKKGSCNNCFIEFAWKKYYIEYLETKNGKALGFIPPKTEENPDSLLQENKKKINIPKQESFSDEFKIIKEYFIIIGCFNDKKNANSYSKKIARKNYQTTIFYEKNANCNLVAIGPYSNKEQSLKDLPKIKKNINKAAWIFTNIK